MGFEPIRFTDAKLCILIERRLYPGKLECPSHFVHSGGVYQGPFLGYINVAATKSASEKSELDGTGWGRAGSNRDKPWNQYYFLNRQNQLIALYKRFVQGSSLVRGSLAFKHRSLQVASNSMRPPTGQWLASA